jgi:hypothetical protein
MMLPRELARQCGLVSDVTDTTRGLHRNGTEKHVELFHTLFAGVKRVLRMNEIHRKADTHLTTTNIKYV